MHCQNNSLACCSILLVFCLASACNVHPAHWCDSIQTATECKVVSQCEDFVWNRVENADEGVNLTLYMESLCPDCKHFTTSQLTPTWKKVGSIMNLVLVPYGNAREKMGESKWQFTCQHGLQECIGNQLETCAIHLHPKTNDHYPFIDCIEAADTPKNVNISAVAEKCASQHGLDFNAIEKCAISPWGNLLEHKMAEKTEMLNPPHKYVPWVTLNGQHTDAIQSAAQTNLLKLICDTYKGQKPQACDE